MAFIGIRELSRQLSRVLGELQQHGEPVVITKQGRPIAALVSVDSSEVESLVLSAATQFQERRTEADEAVAVGQAVRLSDAMPSLMADDDDRALAAYPTPATMIVGNAELMNVDQQINSIHGLVFGREAPTEIIVAAKSEIDAAVESVIQHMAQDEPEVEERVEQLASELFRVFWTHSLLDEAQDRIDDVRIAVTNGVAGAELGDPAKVAVGAAAEQLRKLNGEIVGTSLARGESVLLTGYETAVSSVVRFDEMTQGSPRNVRWHGAASRTHRRAFPALGSDPIASRDTAT